VKLERAKFSIQTIFSSDNPLILDFNPIIDTFNLKDRFALLHWQARPKPWRQWGIYGSKEDNYYSIARINSRSSGLTLQLDDRTCQNLPSAVINYPHSSLSIRSGTATIFGLVRDWEDNIN
jgi:hypothetical protein